MTVSAGDSCRSVARRKSASRARHVLCGNHVPSLCSILVGAAAVQPVQFRPGRFVATTQGTVAVSQGVKEDTTCRNGRSIVAHMGGSTVLHQLSRLCGLPTWDAVVLPLPDIFAAFFLPKLAVGAGEPAFLGRPERYALLSSLLEGMPSRNLCAALLRRSGQSRFVALAGWSVRSAQSVR